MLVRVISAALLLMGAAAAAHTQKSTELPEHFTAFAVSPGGPRMRAGATTVDIRITRWSTPEETQLLVDVLKERGPDALLEELRDMKSVGTINTPGNLAYDLRYSHQVAMEDGGRRVFLATDRPISYWEAVTRPRLSDYPFTFIELRLNAEGEGEGKLTLAAQIEADPDGKVIQLVNYNTQPVLLNRVRRAGG